MGGSGTVRGERGLAVAIGAFGAFWIVQALKLPYWSEFAPGSGFLPLWLGVVIVALVVAFLVQSFRSAPVPPAAAQVAITAGGIGRIVLIMIGLVTCLALLEWAGFVVSVGLYLAFLIGWVERRSLQVTVCVSLGTVAFLWLLFRKWLGVPFPEGPWGF
jgi:putative tricarboxylic transport membrane protein